MHTSAASHLEIELASFGGTANSVFTEDFRFPGDCPKLTRLGELVDAAPGDFKLYPLAKQDSDSEEILDHLAHDRYKCPGAEVPELGPA